LSLNVLVEITGYHPSQAKRERSIRYTAMEHLSSTRKIIVFGVDNLFGEEVVSGLAGKSNSLMLCGDNRERHRKLIERHPDSVKGVCSRENSEYHKQVQVMIESQGSLDAVVYLINPVSGYCFFEQSEIEIRDTFNRNLVEPILMLKAIFPYLKKSADCKVIFVDTGAFLPGVTTTEIQEASTLGVIGFCDAIQNELQGRGVDIRAITSPRQLDKKECRENSSDPETLSYCSQITEKIQDVMRSSVAIHGAGSPIALSPELH
jgi:short-subunit dehydrogenase